MEVAAVELRGRTVAVVRCRAAKRPVALRDPRLQRDQYFVRTGNTTRALDQAQVPQWMAERFGG
jgi:hypothetical protein